MMWHPRVSAWQGSVRGGVHVAPAGVEVGHAVHIAPVPGSLSCTPNSGVSSRSWSCNMDVSINIHGPIFIMSLCPLLLVIGSIHGL